MRTIILLVCGLILASAVQAQVGSSISADGSAPNNNAMLDVKSPTSGAGKGILIPRVSENQRTNVNGTLDGGLLDSVGNLRGGAAQGLIVYQTDNPQGLYFNTSSSAMPVWVYLGEETDPRWSAVSNAILADIAIRLTSNVWAAAGSTTNYLPRTGGTMSGALNMGAQIVTNVAHIDFNGDDVSVGRGAIGNSFGAAVGWSANGTNSGAAVGYQANGNNSGAAMGYAANGYSEGAAVGRSANGSSLGAAVGRSAAASASGVAVGYLADGSNAGVAVGFSADGWNYGVAVGVGAYGARTNVAIGAGATVLAFATQRIAIGNDVNNDSNNTARIRGTLHLDGGSSNIYYRTTFGSGGWTAKTFEIDHPLDPENKILRHYCLEGPQVWNVYAGNAQLVNGQAVVELPDYYSALNLVGSEIYSLTVVDESAEEFPLVKVVKKAADNCFAIAGTQDVKVSWTIKVLRNDPGCREDLKRRPVEQRKSELDLPAVLRPALPAGTGN